MPLLNKYITLIFIVKIIFIILALSNLYLNTKIKMETNKSKQTNETNKTQKQTNQIEIQKNIETQKHIEFWKARIEFIFICLMSILLIFLFNPRQNRLNLITYEAKLLIFLFGIILIITAEWKQFYTESPFFEKLQSVI